MSEFETYDIRAWIVDGLTRHVPVTTNWATRKRASWPSSIALAGALAVSAVTGLSYAPSVVVAPSTHLLAAGAVTSQRTSGSGSRDLVVGSPFTYWTGLASELRSWAPIDASLPEIEPFI